MKILQVVHGFPPHQQAGTELYTFYLSKGLQQKHDVSVFHRELNPDEEDYSVLEDTCEGLPVIKVVNNLTRVDFPTRYYRDERIDAIFSECLTRMKPELVHFHHCIGLSAGMIETTVSGNLPTVVTLHDYWFLCSRVQLVKEDGTVCEGPSEGANCVGCLYGVDVTGGLVLPNPEDGGVLRSRRTSLQRLKPYVPRRIKDFAKQRLGYRPFAWGRPAEELLGELAFRTRYLRNLLNQVDRVIAPSQYVRERMVAHGVSADRLRTIPHGWDTMSGAAPAASRIPYDPTRIRFGYFGTLYPYKGIQDLIAAFVDLRERHELLIYGHGSHPRYERDLRRQARGKRVTFKGRYEHQALPSLLSSVDLVVVPSIWPETFNLVVREALAARRPVIAARIGGLAEAFQEGEGGLFFNPGDVDGLRQRMEALEKDPELYCKLTKSAPAIKSMAEHVVEIEEVYRDALADHLSGDRAPRAGSSPSMTADG